MVVCLKLRPGPLSGLIKQTKETWQSKRPNYRDEDSPQKESIPCRPQKKPSLTDRSWP